MHDEDSLIGEKKNKKPEKVKDKVKDRDLDSEKLN